MCAEEGVAGFAVCAGERVQCEMGFGWGEIMEPEGLG